MPQIKQQPEKLMCLWDSARKEFFMNQSPTFSRYRITLAALCYYCAKLGQVREKIGNGEVITPEEVQDICSYIAKSKTELLTLKAELGFTDGLEFMNDCQFAGFEMKNGIVKGDVEKLFDIIKPWYTEYPSKGNNFQYEVANYLLAYMKVNEEQKLSTSNHKLVVHDSFLKKILKIFSPKNRVSVC